MTSTKRDSKNNPVSAPQLRQNSEKAENVTTDLLTRICQILDCQIGSICEVVTVATKKAIS
ncbi:helix-turn-helix domain-containing protein [Corynebacterium pseudokroppenstedtii]|uniref:helix-turn-helix domain-containing protein n=1 Tax=Corynebacterium pseudokroppenstedtii TaxID=2804917 RepID=UPI001C8F9DEA|nr:helix-turn-helix domain-containing protein [Corynebacterium pseudokroppenstedtii]